MTHEELRAALPAYAAGGVSDMVAAAVRAHIATGCLECLEMLFAAPRPVVPAAVLPPLAVAGTRPAGRPRAGWPTSGLRLALGLAGLGIALGLGWLAGTRTRAAGDATGVLGARLAELEAGRAALAGQLARLEERLAAAEAGRARDETGRQARAEELDTARAAIADLERLVTRRDAEIARLGALAGGLAVRADLLGVPGTALLPLAPVRPFRDVRGHVLWNPRAATIVLYAFGLPPGRYRLRVGGGDGGPAETSPVFTVTGAGDATLPLRLGEPAASMRTVEVVLEPAARAVLTGSR